MTTDQRPKMNPSLIKVSVSTKTHNNRFSATDNKTAYEVARKAKYVTVRPYNVIMCLNQSVMCPVLSMALKVPLFLAHASDIYVT